MADLVAVVSAEKLFSCYQSFSGFLPVEEHDFRPEIIDNLRWIGRKLADKNTNFKQPISYTMIFDKVSGQIFFYRIADKCPEKRLVGKGSIGVGGHYEQSDLPPDIDFFERGAKREIMEEVTISGDYTDPRLIGFINLDKLAVDKVHFGLLYLLVISTSEVSRTNLKQSRMAETEMIPLEPINNRINVQDSGSSIADWTKIAFNYCFQKQIFQNSF